MDECYFRDVRQCSESSEGLTTAGRTRIEIIIECRKAYDDDIHTILAAKLTDDP